MNVKRFTAKTPRDALALVKQAFGEDAVVMSTRPCPEGVEVLAMAPESIQQIERVGASAARVVSPAMMAAVAQPAAQPAAAAPRADVQAQHDTAAARAMRRPAAAGERIEPTFDEPMAPPANAAASVQQDVEQLQMSTLSFQDYVRERMLRRRQAQMSGAPEAEPPPPPTSPAVSSLEQARARLLAQQAAAVTPPDSPGAPSARPEVPQLHAAAPVARVNPAPVVNREPPVLREELTRPQPAAVPGRNAAIPPAAAAEGQATHSDQVAMMSELRSMRGLIEQRFGALAFMEKLQRQPRQAQLTQRLLDAGFSPALTRKLTESLPDDVEEAAWSSNVLERNLLTSERDPALEDAGGVYALIGATGVGKTTSTAKLAAAFAARHGAANLGLITLDAYRVAAHEQLRTYGRILGVPVHTAHDRASLEDLLELLSAKRMVLIDTAGVCQRDNRTRELLEMLQHPSIRRLVVINAAAQGETIEEQLSAYASMGCRGVVLSKVDEAVKLGPSLDAMIRSRLKVVAVANGQRVPEDWHRLSAHALVARALRSSSAPAWKLEPAEVNLIFAGMSPHGVGAPGASGAALARAGA